MDIGLRKAWVEELRKFAGKRIKVTKRGQHYGDGEFKEIFLTGTKWDSQDVICICVRMDGNSSNIQFRIQCTDRWNDNELRWPAFNYAGSSCFIANTIDGEVKFELDNTSPRRSAVDASKIVDGIRQSLRKGLRPGLTLVNLRGRKGVAPALKN